MRDRGARVLLQPLVVFALALVLYGLGGQHGWLYRDDAIFAYSGQQLARGVPPYTSTFHAKNPLSPVLSGLGVSVARLGGVDDLSGVRTAFLLTSAATVVAVMLLAVALFGATSTGLLAAAIFVAFWGFGNHAWSGPRDKTPVVLFATLTLWLLVRKRFTPASVMGSLAFLTWQPMGLYAGAAVALAGLQTQPGRRLRAIGVAIAAAGIPVAVVVAGLAATGALQEFFQDTLVFNLFHLERQELPYAGRLRTALQIGYPGTWPLLVGGVALAAGMIPWRLARSGFSLRRTLCEDRYAGPMLTLLGVLAWTAFDFQSYPDLYPLLPYAAVGCAGGLQLALAGLERRRLPAAARWAVPGLAAVLLVVFSAHQYSSKRSTAIVFQRQWSEQLAQLAGDEGVIVSLGVPQPLVLLSRTNPNRFIFLCCGMESYVGASHPQGFDGWLRDLAAEQPAVIVVGDFRGPINRSLERWLEGYRRVQVGRWSAYVDPNARDGSGG